MILITGAHGQLGREFAAIRSAYPDFQFLYLNRTQLDITNAESIQKVFSSNPIQYCINCAAYTAVDKAENDQQSAKLVNAVAPALLAEACRKKGATMIHFSTDYVYDGLYNRPFSEDHPTQPQSVYARTKLEGEKNVLEILPESMIIRTSWVYSSMGHNFLNTMLKLGQERSQLRVVYDQIGSPTYARHLARAVLDIIQNLEPTPRQSGGIYHYSNEGVCSWYDFALAIFELTGIDCSVEPIESKDFPTPAKRPHFSLLNKAKIKTTFNLSIAHWRHALQDCLTQKEQNPDNG
jgi:dTDP-4-dehydrorhamnose reductase